jgi:hypothetical protein
MSDRIEDRLRALLAERAADATANEAGAGSLIRKARVWRFGIAAAALLVAAASAVAAASLVFSPNPRPQPATPRPQTVATIEVGRVMAVDAGAGGVWTANYEDGTVALVDPANNEVVKTIRVDDELGAGPSDVHVVGNNVWLSASDNMVVGHLDPDNLDVSVAADVGSAGMGDMTANAEAVWVVAQHDPASFEPLSSHGTRIDSATSEVPPPGNEFALYTDIAAGDAGVWALDESEGTLAAISPLEGRPRVAATGEERFTGAQADIAVGHGYVWVETSNGPTSRLARFDPATSETRSISVDGRGGVMAASPDALWLLTHRDDQGLLWSIDPETLAVQPEPLTMNGEFQSAAITYGFGSIWVSHDFNLLSRIATEPGVESPTIAPSPDPRGSGDVCDLQGPWIDCPEARWLRRVIAEARFEVTGETASALRMAVGAHELYAWNATASRPVEDVAADEGYVRRAQTDAFSDGTRFLWEAQGLHLYLSSATNQPIDRLPTSVIDRLISASRTVAREADLTGAQPEPTPTTQERRSEQLPGDRSRVWPISPDVPDEGKYLFTAPHCGIGWMIDFDASFWDAIEPDDYGEGENYPFFYNSDEGTITFTGENSAVYQASTGEEILLNRLPGPTIIDPCE